MRTTPVKTQTKSVEHTNNRCFTHMRSFIGLRGFGSGKKTLLKDTFATHGFIS